jgi:hypothetical protein
VPTDDVNAATDAGASCTFTISHTLASAVSGWPTYKEDVGFATKLHISNRVSAKNGGASRGTSWYCH